jgi:hypothetical protein
MDKLYAIPKSLIVFLKLFDDEIGNFYQQLKTPQKIKRSWKEWVLRFKELETISSGLYYTFSGINFDYLISNWFKKCIYKFKTIEERLNFLFGSIYMGKFLPTLCSLTHKENYHYYNKDLYNNYIALLNIPEIKKILNLEENDND